MANKHKYDIVATTGDYVNRDGEDKKNFLNVGAVYQGDKGPYIVLKAWFNPAAVPRKEGSDSIFLSLFEPKEREDARPAQRKSRDDDDERPAQRKSRDDDDERPRAKAKQTSAPGGFDDMNDDIPF